jgi:hypothetical protein
MRAGASNQGLQQQIQQQQRYAKMVEECAASS